MQCLYVKKKKLLVHDCGIVVKHIHQKFSTVHYRGVHSFFFVRVFNTSWELVKELNNPLL